jgi:hypothetical protein
MRFYVISRVQMTTSREIVVSADKLRMGIVNDASTFLGISLNDEGKVSLTSDVELTESETTTVLVLDGQQIKGRPASSFSKALDEFPSFGGPAVLNTPYIHKAGTEILAVKGASGTKQYQPHFGFSRQSIVDVIWGTSYSTHAIGAPAATGTESFPAFSTTNFLTQTRNAKYISSATAGNACGVHETNAFLWRGDAAKRGGFFLLDEVWYLNDPFCRNYLCRTPG